MGQLAFGLLDGGAEGGFNLMCGLSYSRLARLVQSLSLKAGSVVDLVTNFFMGV